MTGADRDGPGALARVPADPVPPLAARRHKGRDRRRLVLLVGTIKRRVAISNQSLTPAAARSVHPLTCTGHTMIRFKATPEEKPVATPAVKTAKAPRKTKGSATEPKDDLLDLSTDTTDDKD